MAKIFRTLSNWFRERRFAIAMRMIDRGTKILPDGTYKRHVIYAICNVNADICEQAGQLEQARDIRKAIAPLRVGGRKADRVRNRKRF